MADEAKPPGPWLESAWWDGVFLLNVLWLAPVLALAWTLGRADALIGALLKLGALLLWGGHLLSPVVGAWRNPRLRAAMREDRARWIFQPVALFVASFVLAFAGLRGSGASGAYSVLLLAFVVWNTWHFAGQHFGVLSIYRRVLGIHDAATRRADRSYTVLCTCVLLPAAWYLQSERLGPLFQVLPQPALGGASRFLVIGLSITAAVMMLAQERRPSPGRTGYVVSIALQPVLAAVSYPLFNFVLFSVSHWIVAIALASRLLASYPRAGAPAGGGSLRRFLVASCGLVALSVPMYVVFFTDRVARGVPHLVNGMFRRGSELGLQGEDASLALPLVVGLYFGLTFVHFVYDRALWGFRRPEVREGVAPHLFAPIRQAVE